MTFNVGTPDRIARVVLGLLLIVAPFGTDWPLFASTAWAWGAVIIGVILVATGALRFCPAYILFGLNTVRKQK
jgi:hypothetical protein